MILLLCFSIAFSHFYSVILESRGTIDSPVLLPGYRSSFCAHRPEGWAFPCFSFFLPFDVVSSKAHGWLFYSEVRLFLMSHSLWFNFWPSFLFFIFPEWVESNSTGYKVFCCYFLFYSSLLWFPEILFLCIVRGYSRLSSFSCWISDTWEGRIWLSFFFVIFPEWVESNSAGSKVFCCYFLFYSSLLWFPEVLFLCIVKGYSRLSPFSCWISDTWEGRICPLFLVFFLAFSFELS